MTSATDNVQEHSSGRRRRRSLASHGLLALAVTSTVLLAACGSSSKKSPNAITGGPISNQTQPATTAPAAQGVSNACELLTVDEIAAATGFPVGPGKVSSEDSASCKWVVNSGEPGISSVSVDVIPLDEYEYAVAVLSEGVTKVSGVGDEAVWTSSWTLYVRAGQHAFTLQVVVWLDDDPKQQATAKALALKVIKRL